MTELFQMGGPVFMGLVTVVLVAMLVATIFNGITIFNGNLDIEKSLRRVSYIKEIGLLALVVGVLGQLIGLFNSFSAIQSVGQVAPAMLAGGLKVSMITTIYGVLVYVVSYVIWLGFSFRLR